ncbi:hypothetical protein EYF80_010753 [Liparis tanakae]|uniref:Uncharacterized protein n=1 Tax=Liparis tanakae TaxID=230148 RepID=A0A4Z2INP9_9TELE|nr:hypothetical protein EYF80_010753 [Liparis tanakae]
MTHTTIKLEKSARAKQNCHISRSRGSASIPQMYYNTLSSPRAETMLLDLYFGKTRLQKARVGLCGVPGQSHVLHLPFGQLLFDNKGGNTSELQNRSQRFQAFVTQ